MQKHKHGFQGKTVPPSASRRGKREAFGSFPTPEDVLKLVAHKNLQPTDASKPQDSTSGFKNYLEKVREVLIVDISLGQQLESLLVTVECTSLRILEDLWYAHSSKYLNELAQNTLVSKDILEELGLTNVTLTTTISEKEYKECRAQFLLSLGEFESLFLLSKSSVFSYLPLVSIVDPDEQGNKHERSIFPLFLIKGLCCFIVHLFSCFLASSEKKIRNVKG